MTTCIYESYSMAASEHQPPMTVTFSDNGKMVYPRYTVRVRNDETGAWPCAFRSNDYPTARREFRTYIRRFDPSGKLHQRWIHSDTEKTDAE